ncbi:unnamed protein product [Haemonchus placei]|uniref:ShTK domain protein n=1 Tax=Haemonchus placei TaxID=6290 RepID=A0A0N4WK07_HAEPC|nr:unnamed protein product [Haemonchus placei]
MNAGPIQRGRLINVKRFSLLLFSCTLCHLCRAITACEDKVNPTTKVSDCARVAYLCNDALYYRLMTEQCPKTCNRCPGASVTTTMAPTPAPVTTSCRDLVNPRTGVSNCATVAYLCNNPYYYQLMTQQCPRTCNRCPSTVAPISTTCRDLVDPRTGVSNCPSVSNLCRDTNYYNLMKQQCPKTCGYCT